MGLSESRKLVQTILQSVTPLVSLPHPDPVELAPGRLRTAVESRPGGVMRKTGYLAVSTGSGEFIFH